MKKIHCYLSELIGTFIMMIIGVSAIVINLGTVYMREHIPNEWLRLLLTVVYFAAGVSAVIYSPVGRISGAHINPALTFAFWLEQKINHLDALIYSLMQFLGSIAASFILFWLWSDKLEGVKYGMTVPGEGYSIMTVFTVEMILTSLLISLVFYCLHHHSIIKYTGLAVGMYIVVAALAAATISGASFNPARSLGPAIIAVTFPHQWIYIVAPLSGAALTVVLHRIIEPLKRPVGCKLNCLLEEYHRLRQQE